MNAYTLRNLHDWKVVWRRPLNKKTGSFEMITMMRRSEKLQFG